jgi:hypothetical protein
VRSRLVVVYFLLSIGGAFGLKDPQGRAGVIVASLVGIADHRGGDLRLVLQGNEPDDRSRRGTA